METAATVAAVEALPLAERAAAYIAVHQQLQERLGVASS